MSEMEYLYVVEFSNGTIKVGRTGNLDRRIAQHRMHGDALGVPVRRVWTSDGHVNSDATEQHLLRALGKPSYGNEWFDAVLFDDAVRVANDAIQLSTEPELYNKRLMDAKRLLEAHTGRRIKVDPVSYESDVAKYFLFDPNCWTMSSVAYAHYRGQGGQLGQKEFIAALEREGVERRRANEGTRLWGIYLSA